MPEYPVPIASPPAGALAARRILLRGRVQGVGFRPFVHRLAGRCGLGGWVRNLSGQVVVHAEGPVEQLEEFETALLAEAPGLSRPEVVRASSAVPTGLDIFFIEESEAGEGMDVSVPPDVALCSDCRRELWDPRDRRHRYPFLNCTRCGPRYTIIASLPYDRRRTSMERFPLCPACRSEYEDIGDRRYHAEPVACPACGPRIELIESGGAGDLRSAGAEGLLGDGALARCVEVLEEGGIVALRGVGGYHLVCDATSVVAVRNLRARKLRPGKPLAVMVPREGVDGLDAARGLARIRPAVADILTSDAHPIVLVRRLPRGGIAADVAPGLGELGLMLPYSPLHELLLRAFGRPVVATSGNSSGEPLVSTRRDAEQLLSGLADAFLHHDRPILRSVDDSVLRDFGDGIVPIRIGRGYAPLELSLPRGTRTPRLAVGGHMKNTVALAWDERVVLSPHIGDLERPRALDAFIEATESLRALYGVAPGEILADAHPDYASTRWARGIGLPIRTVPHHRAHASALAGEHPDVERWLVLSWDGVGLGEDGSLWGGEVFHGSPGRWERVGSVRSFRIVGAGRAGREPLRSAQSLAWAVGLQLPAGLEPPAASAAAALVRGAWEREVGTWATTAVGRIFDAAAAMVLGRTAYDYEAQGPMELEAAADAAGSASGLGASDSGSLALFQERSSGISLPTERDADSLWRIDWGPLIPRLLDEDLTVAERAAMLHAALAEAAVTLAARIHRERPFDAIGLAGGVFQNRRLTEELRARSKRRGFDVRMARQVPMNDGGLAYGQVIEAIASEA